MASKMTSLIFLSFSLLAAGNSNFRGREGKGSAHFGDGVEVGEVRAKLQEALDHILSSSSTAAKDKSIETIKAKMLPTFQALPKVSENRLGPLAVHHILRSYFRNEHGWTLFGFEPPSEDSDSNPVNVTGASAVLQEKVPAIMEAVLEAREHGQGLTLPEVVAVAAALERLILDESVQLLHMSYDMNGFDDEEPLDTNMMHEVLVTYLALFQLPNKTQAHNMSPFMHRRWKEQRRAAGKLRWEGEMAGDALVDFDFERQGVVSPFQQASYDFETAASVVDRVAKQHGRLQDEGCRVMRDALEIHDVTGSGRVSLEDFHSIGSISFFILSEPAEKLREIGALDESDPRNPTVRIANYVLAPSNCNRNSNYYHVCCISTCDAILNELEAKFMAPSVDAESLLNFLIVNMSTTGDKELNIPASPLLGPSFARLASSLRTIAVRHDGLVPLHGKLFAKWMHFAFPRDCPLPVMEQTVTDNSTQDVVAMKLVAPAEWASDMDFHMPADDTRWTDDEDVSLFEDLKLSSKPSKLYSALRLAAMVGACAAFFGVSLQQMQTAAAALKPVGSFKKAKNEDNFLLPMRF